MYSVSRDSYIPFGIVVWLYSAPPLMLLHIVHRAEIEPTSLASGPVS